MKSGWSATQYFKVNSVGIKRRTIRGFTVVQMLLLLVSVLVYVWNFSPETFTQFLGKDVDISAGKFAESLRDARSSAQDRKVNVTVCKTDDGKKCNAKLQWQSGWMYFADVNGNGKVDSADDEILKVVPAIGKGTTIGSHNVVLSSITFAAAGHTLSRKGNPVAGKFVFCDGYRFNDSSRIVTFNYQGTVHLEFTRDVTNVSCGG